MLTKFNQFSPHLGRKLWVKTLFLYSLFRGASRLIKASRVVLCILYILLKINNVYKNYFQPLPHSNPRDHRKERIEKERFSPSVRLL